MRSFLFNCELSLTLPLLDVFGNLLLGVPQIEIQFADLLVGELYL